MKKFFRWHPNLEPRTHATVYQVDLAQASEFLAIKKVRRQGGPKKGAYATQGTKVSSDPCYVACIAYCWLHMLVGEHLLRDANVSVSIGLVSTLKGGLADSSFVGSAGYGQILA